MDWKLVEHRATTHWGKSVAIVDTLDLRSGLSIQAGTWQGSNIGTLPKMIPTMNPASVESYVRGTDLVTTHPATTERPTRVQLYWRKWEKLPAPITGVLELIVSVQTHLLDSDPSLVIESRLPNVSAADQLDDKVDAMNGPRQLLMLAHAQDDTDSELLNFPDGSPGALIRHTLFRRRLEKGVILRGRLLFIWSDDGVDADALQACEDRFYFSDPVLTT